MPRYFFHLFNTMHTHDEEGTQLPDLKAARSHAVKEARHVMSADVKDRGEINLSHFIDVGDAGGETLAVVTFDDAVTIIRAAA